MNVGVMKDYKLRDLCASHKLGLGFEQCGKKALIKKVQRPSHSVCLRSGVGFFYAE